MRFLADENVPGPCVDALRERGHDVLWIKESMPGADDPVVLELAQRSDGSSSPPTPTSVNSRFDLACPPNAVSS